MTTSRNSGNQKREIPWSFIVPLAAILLGICIAAAALAFGWTKIEELLKLFGNFAGIIAMAKTGSGWPKSTKVRDLFKAKHRVHRKAVLTSSALFGFYYSAKL